MNKIRDYDTLVSKLNELTGFSNVEFGDYVIGNDASIRIAYLKSDLTTIDTGMLLKFVDDGMFKIAVPITESRIDFERRYHKQIKRFLRKCYNNLPVFFGYALRAPCDMHDDIFSTRIALERLIFKLENPRMFTVRCYKNLQKRLS